MELKGYQSQVQPGQQSVQSSEAIHQAGQRQQNSVLNRLSQFSDIAAQSLKYQAQDQAVEDAQRDSREGKAFHKESVYSVYGRAYNNTASATYSANANIAMQQKSDELQMEFENNPLGYDTAMQSFVKEMADTAPTEDISATIRIGGTKIKNGVFGDLSIAENNRIKASQLETFSQELELNINQIIQLDADGKTADSAVLKHKNLVYLNTMMDEGLIDEATGKKYINDTEFKINHGVALKIMEDLLEEDSLVNAKAYLDEQTAKARGDMDIVENKKYNDDLNHAYNNELKSRDAEKKSRTKFANEGIDEAIKVFKAGRIPDNLQEVYESIDLASPKKQDELDLQIAVYSQSQEFLGMPIVEVEAEINKMLSDPIASLEEVLIAKTSQANLNEKKKKIKSDPISLGYEEGIIDVEAPLSISGGIDGLMKNLPLRKMQSARVQEDYGEGATQLFTAAEAKEWADYLSNPNTSLDEQLSFLRTVQGVAGEDAKIIFNQLDENKAPTLAFAGNLSLAGNDKAAKIALQGKGAKVQLPESFETLLKTKIQGVFKGYGSKFYNQHYNGLVDYAKGLILGDEDASDLDTLLESSIGIMKTYNGQKAILPQGVDVDTFESWLDKIKIPERPGLTKGLNDMSDTLFDGDYQLHYAGNGEYYVKIANDGSPYFARDTEDETKPFILKYNEQ